MKYLALLFLALILACSTVKETPKKRNLWEIVKKRMESKKRLANKSIQQNTIDLMKNQN